MGAKLLKHVPTAIMNDVFKIKLKEYLRVVYKVVYALDEFAAPLAEYLIFLKLMLYLLFAFYELILLIIIVTLFNVPTVIVRSLNKEILLWLCCQSILIF